MAKRRRKLRVGRVILLFVLLIAIIAGLVLSIKGIIGLISKDGKKDNPPIDVITNNTFSINLLDYEVYEDKNEELGFNFVVAELEFKDEKAISYDLANLITDEGYRLNDVASYQKKMNVNSYDYDSLKTSVDIVSDKKDATFKVFVPYVKASDMVILTDMQSGSSFKIDITKKKADIDTLKHVPSPSEIVTKDVDIEVSDNFISTMMTHDGESYDCSMLSVYTYKLKVRSITDGLKIDSAVFTQSSTGEKWDALDASYSSVKIENIIRKQLKAGDEYALFFEVYSNDEDKPRYEGTITLNFSDGSSAIIDATLN